MNQNEKEDRKERYERRHDHVQKEVTDSAARRKTPYKRKNIDYDDYLEEEMPDEWFEQNI